MLKFHIKIHNGVKDYQCEICNKSFSQKSSLTKHMKIHTGQKEYHCEICNKEISHKCNLTIHIRNRINAEYVMHHSHKVVL